MAENVHRIVGHLETVDHDHGHWCRDCMRGTGVRAFMVARFALVWSLRVYVWCTECGGDDVETLPVDDARHC